MQAPQKRAFLVPNLEQEVSHHEVGLWGIWDIWVLTALVDRDILKPDLAMCFALNPSQQLNSSLCFARSQSLLIQPRVKGHSNPHSEMDLIPTMTLPPVGKGCVRMEEHVGGLLGGTSDYFHP